MKRGLAILIVVLTAALLAAGWLQAGGLKIQAERSGRTPDEAVRALMASIQARDWDRAYRGLDHSNDLQQADFVREIAGADGSLRTYSNLQSFDIWPVHASAGQAMLRVRLNWSSAVGSLAEVRDLQVVRSGDAWKVVWPRPNFAKVPLHVLPVNYLRWDVVGRRSDDWGTATVDSPQVRILSMNAVERPDSVVVVGEVENEDTVPAYLNISAALLKSDGSVLAQQDSFDAISHSLLPKQVSPYRIDFPGARLSQVKSVRIDAHPLLIPASADPVISVENQSVSKDALGRSILKGSLVNQSGQIVNIAQVLAVFYDTSGKAIWVSDGYVDQALQPQAPVPFAVDIPADVANRMHDYHVAVNHYTAPSA
ncbi:MAG TPA: hypothetical protein VFA40_24245 [Terriglobales bacterium]|nr:hypothetical protein [Terriglobales bacterium]